MAAPDNSMDMEAQRRGQHRNITRLPDLSHMAHHSSEETIVTVAPFGC